MEFQLGMKNIKPPLQSRSRQSDAGFNRSLVGRPSYLSCSLPSPTKFTLYRNALDILNYAHEYRSWLLRSIFLNVLILLWFIAFDLKSFPLNTKIWHQKLLTVDRVSTFSMEPRSSYSSRRLHSLVKFDNNLPKDFLWIMPTHWHLKWYYSHTDFDSNGIHSYFIIFIKVDTYKIQKSLLIHPKKWFVWRSECTYTRTCIQQYPRSYRTNKKNQSTSRTNSH